MAETTQFVIPRWRGFNLLEMFTTTSSGDFHEDDLRWIRDWGFDFIRIPACYTLWTKDNDPFTVEESMLEKLDRIVNLCVRFDLHLSINFHRAPGFSVNLERIEPFNLWKDDDACDAFCFQWKTLASRYRSISSMSLSFDLVNEPPTPGEAHHGHYPMDRADHERVIRSAVSAIREVDPDRLIVADGMGYGRIPVPELIDTGISQSCRGYEPMGVSHYQAQWVGGENFPPPRWPGADHYGSTWGQEELRSAYQPWLDLAAQGVGVHCGEAGAFNKTPHEVVLDWFDDVLAILTPHGIGYALWNLRGPFGILDSQRDDVAYDDWYGHRLDREYLELLQRY